LGELTLHRHYPLAGLKYAFAVGMGIPGIN